MSSFLLLDLDMGRHRSYEAEKAKETKDTAAEKAKQGKEATMETAGEYKDHTAEKAKEGKETTLGKIVELKDTAVDTAKRAMGFLIGKKEETEEKAAETGEAAKEPVFVYCGATAPPRRFSEPETAAALIEDFQEKYGCVILSETFKTPLSPTLRGETRARRGGRVRLFRRYGVTETLLGTRHGGGIDRRPSRTIWLRDFIGDFQDAIISNLAASRTRWPCSSIPELRRRFSEPDTAAVLIGDLQEQYGCVILSETFKTPLSPTLRRAGRGGRVHLFRRYGATETLLGTRLGSLAGRGGRLRLFRRYGPTETLLRTRLGGGIYRRLSRRHCLHPCFHPSNVNNTK
ncbi:hypothetical protein U1Q18_023815 [Sarracenia purpurea var. burkii]